ncbi:hypothetical protein WJX73_010861 [Symbiochloris irregularis]|uniref:Tyrosine--tRNA ligase n=1 Tax=Symbiochloris irregularis TaxID=706552 RepID=A0AAW1PDP4_9CHLO
MSWTWCFRSSSSEVILDRVISQGRRVVCQLNARHFFAANCPLRRAHAPQYNSIPAKAASSDGAVGAQPSVIQILRERGLVQDTANEGLEATAAETSLALYCGFDPTADSLHLGHLLSILVLKWFQRSGHKPIALLGGATGRVGDPSGRSLERPVLSVEEIESNVRAIQGTLQSLLRDTGSEGNGKAQHPATVLNNLEWFGGMGMLAFLRDIGKFARVNVMLSRESVKQRLSRDEGISFTEFTYQLLQGFDFVHLCRHHGVRLQIGGSDQMGNILTGLELARKLGDEGGQQPLPPCYGLVFPLLTTSDGTKMGKSASGAIWLSPDKLSPFKFYQYLVTSVPDADVIRFLKMLTFLPLGDIEALQASMGTPDYSPNTAQRLLASEVTRFVHGEEGLQQALNATQALAPGGSTQLDAAALEAIAQDAPTAKLSRQEVVGKPLADVMVAAGLQPSKAASRRMIKGGGVRINNEKVSDEAQTLEGDDLIDDRMLLLAAGKKNKMLVHVT